MMMYITLLLCIVIIEFISLPGKHTTVATVHPVASVVLFAQQSHDSSMESASQATPPFVAEKDFVLRFCSSLCLSSTLHATGSCGFLCASCPCVPSTPTTVNCKGIEIQFLKAKIPPSTAVNSYLGKGHLWNMLENPPTAHCRVALSPLPVSQSHGALFGCYHHM